MNNDLDYNLLYEKNYKKLPKAYFYGTLTFFGVSAFVALIVLAKEDFALALLAFASIIAVGVAISYLVYNWAAVVISQKIVATDALLAIRGADDENGSVNTAPTDSVQEKQIAENQSEKRMKHIVYDCISIVVLDDKESGTCPICRDYHHELFRCKIKTDIGTRDMAICSECIKEFREKSSAK